MAYEPGRRYRSPIVGHLNLPPGATGGTGSPDGGDGPDPHELVPMIVELNVRYPGGLGAVHAAFHEVWEPWTTPSTAPEPIPPATTEIPPPSGLVRIAPKLYQCVLSRTQLRAMVERDRALAEERHLPTAVFRVWPDYEMTAQIDRSAPTVKADAAWRSYGARGNGVVWAVIDSGIDGCHPHFSRLELADEARGQQPRAGRTTNLHRDFSSLVHFGAVVPPAPALVAGTGTALVDESGHGTHVAGIIAGQLAEGTTAAVAGSEEPSEGAGYVPRSRPGVLSGMAPSCELVSIKVMRRSPVGGLWVTSSSAVIAALTYLRSEVNVDPAVLRVHGVNLSLGCPWEPRDYAAGQSPLCQALNQLVASGVVVVISAGNFGASSRSDSTSTSAVLGSITEPAHAEDCIAVGSTHRDAPHAFGVTWTSGKGPTLDGRMKPDVVAPGEWITSAASGEVRAKAGLDGVTDAPYAEQSGTSMAAPHVSGVVAAFLSARPEFIGRPRQVKQLLMQSATDLGRERYAQGAGLVDLMRMLSDV
jgi:subtilisin family serine protease